MGRFKTELRNEYEYFPKVCLTYVDNKFASFDTSHWDIEELIDSLNKEVFSFKFTVENGNEEQLRFLEVFEIRIGENLDFEK